MSFAAPLIAQDVTLTSRDGSVEIPGTLLGYDGEFYRIRSIYGELTLDGSGVLCTGPGCPDLDTFVANIRISGSSVIGEHLIPELIQAFAKQHEFSVDVHRADAGKIFELSEIATGQSAARFTVTLSTSSEGFADLLTEEADIAMSMRDSLPQEDEHGIKAGFGSFSDPGHSQVIALDALVPVVSPKNPVHDISPENLAMVFAGEITNWNILGGLDAPIILHLQSKDSGLLHGFNRQIMASPGRQLADNIYRHPTTDELVLAVAKDPFAVGLSTLSKHAGIRQLHLVGGCGFRALAEPQAIKSDDYPLNLPMYLYVRSRRLPAIGREFLRFNRSPDAQTAVLRAGFIDQTISRTAIGQQGNRLANAIHAAGDEIKLPELKRLVGAMDGARRLSVTFRFDDGSSRLNAQSRSNIALLAHALETGGISAKNLIFVGFSDGEGSADANQKLSKNRAASVRTAVLQQAAAADPGRVSIGIEGFGEALPMACDDTDWGRQINRRVEVWVR
ncbi:MAG: phosphate ABC transporter substrate-binding/OmpA family protein [Paracoccaceae bacterium]